MKESSQIEPNEPIEPRRAFRQLAGKLKARTQQYQHRGEKGERPEFWAGALMATKGAVQELQKILRRDWRV